MDPLIMILLLVAVGIVLLVAELLLPTHGALGVIGLLCFGGAIAVCFQLNRWVGLIVFFAAVLASPFLLSLSMKIWAKSPVGRKIILQPVHNSRPSPQVSPGQIGITVTEMRPMGECEFGEHRLEAASEMGIIPPGKKVKVVAIVNGRPIVRPAEA